MTDERIEQAVAKAKAISKLSRESDDPDAWLKQDAWYIGSYYDEQVYRAHLRTVTEPYWFLTD